MASAFNITENSFKKTPYWRGDIPAVACVLTKSKYVLYLSVCGGNIMPRPKGSKKMKKQTKKVLTKNVITHTSAVLVGYLLALVAISAHKDNKFQARQDAAIYMTDARGRNAELNREIFNPRTFESVAWQYNTNQRVGEVLGKTAAKEYAMDMEALKSGTVTSTQMFGEERDYCAEAVVRAYNNAASRLRFRRANARVVPFSAERCDSSETFQRAMHNAKHMVKFFETDSVPNAIIKKVDEAAIIGASAGSIIRRGRHCYMYMGVGYIDKDGRTFVADSRGRPVIASDDTDQLFEYFDWTRCTIIDIPNIVEYKLQNDVQRHVR